MFRLITLLYMLYSTAVLAGIRPESFPVESMINTPFPSEMVAANQSDQLAYVLNERGVRNIYLSSSSNDKTLKLTSNISDDGIELSNLTFTPDDKFIVYVRGSSPNSSGTLPNPAARALPESQSLYLLSTSDKKLRKLDDGAIPAIHPMGQQIAYVKSGKIWLKDLFDDGAKAQNVVTTRGSIADLTWSPNGQHLAFVSHRSTHSFIGIWHAKHPKKIRWISPSVDRDISPVWSPDSQAIAFIRLPTPSEEHLPFEPIREDIPWSIYTADPISGQSQLIWTATAGLGSANRMLESKKQLLWGKAGKIVFAWEKNGWNQLYAINKSDKKLTHLTPGKFEVQTAVLSKDKNSVFYTSNQNDLHRRHIWQVKLNGNIPELLTPGDGIEWSPRPMASGGIGLIRSTALKPARAAILDIKNGIKDLAAEHISSEFPRDLVVPVNIDITASDGMTVHAQLFIPNGLKDTDKAPVAIFLHGGSRRQMLLGWHMMSYYHNAYGMSQYLASRGVIALSLNYRSGTGYGMEFREALNYGATGNSEFRDVLAAAEYLKNRKDVDANKISVWGGSYGGYLTAHSLAQASDTFVAGVDIHGVHDWNDGIKIFVPHFDKQNAPIDSAIADRASPFNHLDTWRSPVLVIHGDDDRNVYFSQTSRLVRKLRERNVPVEQLVFPDELHGFLLHKTWLQTYNETAGFLLRHLSK